MPKILIVDDDDALRALMKMRLSDTYEVIDTGNPVQALGLALEHKPDAVLLDLMMPDTSGFELCQSLQHPKLHLSNSYLWGFGLRRVSQSNN